MSIARHHAEWLSLVEVSGPFLSMPVLMRVFPQGLEAHDPERFRFLRMAYEEWDDNNQAGPRLNPAIHANWIKYILRNVLEHPEACIAEGQAIPQTLQTTIAQQGETLRPSLAVLDQGTQKPRLLIQSYPFTQDLSKPVVGSTWKASPDTRMMELLHATGVRLGLVTNGEQWMLVDAPRNETTGFASWYAHLWLEEKITLQAFTSLLNANRFFGVSDKDTLETMLTESAGNQQEVTDQLGYQVRKAVEVLVQSLDRADQDHGRELLASVPETELYEAALTVMMRLVFLFCAEERGLILLGDAIYDENYAVSTLEEQLRETADQHGEEILERRHDAWCRLLSTFRGVFGGIQHERMNLPPYGGKLFDPDRFPFLEGRKRGTTWKLSPASPLPVNNRTVLHLLDALQLLQIKLPGGGPAEARRLSFRALDIEQIGHVYEGLLDHTAKRATEPVLGLAGGKNKEPEISISQLEQIAAKGEDALAEFLKEQTGRSTNAIKKVMKQELDLTNSRRIEAVCGSSAEGQRLLDRIKPYVGLIREDSFGYPVVIPTGSFYVTSGTDRRSSGTHYTPRSLTEPIVRYTLEPLVFIGPAEGKPESEWTLRPAAELLKLKICDMTCGSGAFHVQTCRYLAERLVEAWEHAERNLPSPSPGKLQFPTITPEGKPSTGQPGETLIPKDADERLAYAKRIVAQRCIYGVDINPLATEMAKLSMWLLTLGKDKPFTFLDHSIRCGDSLLGINNINQLKTFSLDGLGKLEYLFTEPLDKLVDEAIALRLRIESMPSNTVEDTEEQARLMAESERKLGLLKCTADMLIAAELKGGSPRERLEHRDHAAVQVGYYLKEGNLEKFRILAKKELGGRHTFHWPLEFPEVMVERGGFDAFVGNPPFMGGGKLETQFGTEWRKFLVVHLGKGVKGVRGAADLCAYFLLSAHQNTRRNGTFGMVATNTIAQGDSREIAFDEIIKDSIIIRANPSIKWPGQANLEVAQVWIIKGEWTGEGVLDSKKVFKISAFLTDTDLSLGNPHPLQSNLNKAFEGVKVMGIGFTVSEEEAKRLIVENSANADVLFPFLIGQDINSRPNQSASRWAIWFKGSLSEAEKYPSCLSIVRSMVKPERDKMIGRNPMATQRGTRWWRYAGDSKYLYEAIKDMDRVLVRSRHSNLNCMVFYRPSMIFSDATTVFSFDKWEDFAVMQSCFHTIWVEQYASSIRTDVRYTPSTCFEPFPLPTLASVATRTGQKYYEFRSDLMLDRNEGLTKTYNRFHDPLDNSDGTAKLRQLHVDNDNAVACAYGWSDLKLEHGFHQTKQSIRFTVNERARRDLLIRLLKLNHNRYAEEVAKGLHEKQSKSTKTVVKKKSVFLLPEESSLFAVMSYPATETDRAICSASLAILEQTGNISSVDHMVILRFATHPDQCEFFLEPTDKQRVAQAKANTSSLLFVGNGESIRWKEARDYLEIRKALKVDHASHDQTISVTPILATVKSSLPDVGNEMIALAIRAMDNYRAILKDASKANQKQKQLQAMFASQAQSWGIAV
jgi:hypothetical protein